MHSNEKHRLEDELQDIVTATIKLSFPFLSGKKEKETMIGIEKERIDCLVDNVTEKYHISIDAVKCGRNKLWDDAQNISMEKFSTLPTALQINSFSLQELMHEYADSQVKQILRLLSVEN